MKRGSRTHEVRAFAPFAACAVLALALSSVLLLPETSSAQANPCAGLSGAAFGLCNAYCNGRRCPERPADDRACERLRRNFERHTGTTVFPCDVASPSGAFVEGRPGRVSPDAN